MSTRIEVFGRRGDGSDMAEAFLTLAGIPYDFMSLEKYDEPGPDRDRLLALNSLGQVPTLRLPNGKILTESLAVAVYAQTANPEAPLIPKDTNLIPDFWRYAVMLVAAIYPTFTYGDNPAKWVGEAAGPQLRKSTDERCKTLWRFMEQQAGAPYFLGTSMTALDIYVRVMTRWRPGPAWFEAETPKLLQIQHRVSEDPRLKSIWG
ncbi:glutathione S-transferase family protein [Oligoflexus tunisiensis]|uniref:glutathione S-transferase family protein n=1 Tax=Oligoflexus tunisiensis TaxID=708132 RepID=UPI00114CDDEC|nr:glutathione S-transferase family protein [Oligoflexus tunisiensis]